VRVWFRIRMRMRIGTWISIWIRAMIGRWTTIWVGITVCVRDEEVNLDMDHGMDQDMGYDHGRSWTTIWVMSLG
jgi:uncharacterized protein YacL (UPF0231 family)